MGFRQVRVGSFPQTGLDRVRFPPGCREHDHCGSPASSGAKLVEHLDAIHSGHRNVQKNELGLVLFDHSERFDARRGRSYLIAVLRQKGFVESSGIGKVVDDEDVAARQFRPRLCRKRGGVRCRGRAQDRMLPGISPAAIVTSRLGRTSVNVEPSLSVERTSISPPSARASRRESTRPMPVPG